MPPKIFPLAISLLVVSLSAAAQEVKFNVTLEAGNELRSRAPASVRLALDAMPPQIVKLAGGVEPVLMTTGSPVKSVPAQIEFSHKADGAIDAIIVHWIEDRLELGKSRQYLLTLQPAQHSKAGSRAVPAEKPAGEKKDGSTDAEKRTEKKQKKGKDGAAETNGSSSKNTSTPPPVSSFEYRDGEGFKELLFDKIPVYRGMHSYEASTTAKPFDHIYGFHNDGFITKGPGGQFPHQRGIFLGWNKVRVGGKTYDFWKCDSASQQHQAYVKEREAAGPVFARSAAVTNWLDPSGKVLLHDTREVTAWAVEPGEQTVLDFVVTLETVSSDVDLAGDPHHAGLQFRAAQEVADKPTDTQYVFPENAKPEQSSAATAKDDKRVRDAKSKASDDDDDGGTEGKAGVLRETQWVDSIFKIKEHSYGVVLMDHPQSPRPMTQVVRSYGRIGSFFETQLRKGSPVTARFRFVIYDADRYKSRDPKDFAAMYTSYRSPLKGTAVPASGQ